MQRVPQPAPKAQFSTQFSGYESLFFRKPKHGITQCKEYPNLHQRLNSASNFLIMKLFFQKDFETWHHAMQRVPYLDLVVGEIVVQVDAALAVGADELPVASRGFGAVSQDGFVAGVVEGERAVLDEAAHEGRGGHGAVEEALAAGAVRALEGEEGVQEGEDADVEEDASGVGVRDDPGGGELGRGAPGHDGSNEVGGRGRRARGREEGARRFQQRGDVGDRGRRHRKCTCGWNQKSLNCIGET
jgi:hypothetical protein